MNSKENYLRTVFFERPVYIPMSVGPSQGGLCFIYGLYPGTPMENVEAVFDAMERYMGYFD